MGSGPSQRRSRWDERLRKLGLVVCRLRVLPVPGVHRRIHLGVLPSPRRRRRTSGPRLREIRLKPNVPEQALKLHVVPDRRDRLHRSTAPRAFDNIDLKDASQA